MGSVLKPYVLASALRGRRGSSLELGGGKSLAAEEGG